AIFSPVRKVNYKVEHTRVSQATNYDKLILDVWTDGTIKAVDAISQSADIIIEQFQLFSHMGRPALPAVERGLGAGVVLTPETFNMSIEDLQLSMRAYNCLRRSGLMTVGQVLAKSEEELLALRNFGRKSYDELRAKLDELGLLPQEQPEEELMEAPSLEEEEPFIAAPPVGEGPAPSEEAAAAPEAAEEAQPVKAEAPAVEEAKPAQAEAPAVEEAKPAQAEAPAVEEAPAKAAPKGKKGKKKKAPESEEVAAAAEAPAIEEEEGLAARLTPEQRKKLLELKGEDEG
ncbi:MAG: DNA-directed RNA polymerase subunit alpha C-terminal domain-containing protein, partial [Dehalococcoidia bacterium]